MQALSPSADSGRSRAVVTAASARRANNITVVDLELKAIMTLAEVAGAPMYLYKREAISLLCAMMNQAVPFGLIYAQSPACHVRAHLQEAASRFLQLTSASAWKPLEGVCKA